MDNYPKSDRQKSREECKTIKVAFDYQIFVQPYGGISRYFVRLAQELLSLGEDATIVAPIHRNRYLSQLPTGRVFGIRHRRRPPKSKKLIGAVNRQISSLWIRNHCPDLMHETYYAAKPLDGPFKGRLLTVYDMIHEKFPEEFPTNDSMREIKQIAIARADHILCISQNTKNDLCELLDVPDERVSVAHLGFERMHGSTPNTIYSRMKRPYLLYVGRRNGYKNFAATLKAVASRPALQDSFDIVAFGGGPFDPHEKSMIGSLGFDPNSVRQIEGDDQVLGAFYSDATALVYPSLYEGFGLPTLEAMAHNCPVVTSNTSSMPEVVGPAGEYFDPTDIDAQAEAINRAVFDSERREKLISKGKRRLDQFSWLQCATKTCEVYRALLCR